MERQMTPEEARQHARLDLNISYPYDPNYEYKTQLERLDLDKERENDIMHDKGFIIAPSQGIKKDLKNQFSIFSSKFGQTIKDVNPFGNRYRCECGYLQNKVNNGCLCPVCNTRVKYVDDDYNYFGWFVLKDYYIISPAFYSGIRYFIGKDFDKIIEYDPVVDEDGHQQAPDRPKDQPFYGIGLIEFRERFDEVMEYYANKNKSKVEYYNDIMAQKDIVWTQSIPVFTVLLRPYDVDRFTFSHEATNAYYNSINTKVTALNRSKLMEETAKSNGASTGPIRKNIQKMLLELQLKLDKLYNEIIDIIKGKKGNIRSLFGGRCNFTSRNVITADPTLRIDEVRIPYSALIELLQQSILNILTKTYNLSYADAYRKWYQANLKKDKTIINIINSIIKNSMENHRGLPVLINRNPTISYGSILQMYCVGISDPTEKFEYVMQLPLQILPLLAADSKMPSGSLL